MRILLRSGSSLSYETTLRNAGAVRADARRRPSCMRRRASRCAVRTHYFRRKQSHSPTRANAVTERGPASFDAVHINWSHSVAHRVEPTWFAPDARRC